MSDQIRPNWLLTEDEIFDWLSAGPRTYNWQALLAIDRTKTNQLLLQEYVQRYSRDVYFEPITRAVKTADGSTQVWEYLYEHVLGPPRLSFENSDTNEWARLNMPILGGIQMTVEQSGVEKKKVSQICWYDPLQAPRLIAEIRLEDTDGEVDEKSRVELDLSFGMNFRTTFASTYQQQVKGGELYKAIFDALEPEKKRYLLGEVGEFAGDSMLAPERFRLRALSARPPHTAGEEGASEGAILLFIGMRGQDSGGLPDKDAKWVYPIPEGRSSTLLIANAVIVEGLLTRGIGLADFERPKHRYTQQDGVVTSVTVFEGLGRPRVPDVRMPGEVWSYDFEGHYSLSDFEQPSHYTISRVGEEIHMSWNILDEHDHYHWVSGTNSHGQQQDDFGTYWVQFKAESKYRFALSQEDSSVVLELAEAEVGEVNLVEWQLSDRLEQVREKFRAMVEEFVPQGVLDLQRKVAASFGELEVFRLYGLMFTGAQVVQQRSVRNPCDLAVFGDISPSLTTFQLNPVEMDIIHGGSIQFTANPPQSGLVWTLDAVPGFGGALGSISQSGAYTAPKAEDIPESHAYTMVRVTATLGDVTSSGLVRVVRRSTVVNPMVVAAGKVARKVRFSAGSLIDGALEWEVDSATGATLTDEPPDEDAADFDPGDMFYVPGTGSSGAPFSVDRITVTDADGNVASADLILMEKALMGSVQMLDSTDLPAGKVQLGFDLGDDEPLTSDASWEVIAGGGSVDADGIFSVDPSSAYAYAVVASTFDAGPLSFKNFIILPVPLVDLDAIQRALR